MLVPGLFAKWSIVEIVKQRTLLKDLSSLFRNISISLSPILLLMTELIITLRGHSFVSCSKSLLHSGRLGYPARAHWNHIQEMTGINALNCANSASLRNSVRQGLEKDNDSTIQPKRAIVSWAIRQCVCS